MKIQAKDTDYRESTFKDYVSLFHQLLTQRANIEGLGDLPREQVINAFAEAVGVPTPTYEESHGEQDGHDIIIHRVAIESEDALAYVMASEDVSQPDTWTVFAAESSFPTGSKMGRQVYDALLRQAKSIAGNERTITVRSAQIRSGHADSTWRGLRKLGWPVTNMDERPQVTSAAGLF